MSTRTHPRLSVIVPAHDGEATLAESLTALLQSDLPRDRWELILVDDASTDRTAEIGEALADRVLRIDGTARGPAHARNQGAEAAGGDILAFVDADVCVHASALRQLVEVLSESPDVVAVFGAYDTEPRAPGLVSQYRNLVHHYVHATQPGDADTFWAGLGAVRPAAFRRAGGFDQERYPRPQIEDIELGYRLRALGYRIVLDPSIQGTHLKRWRLRGLIRGDVLDRGAPWMRLLLERKAVGPGTLNIGMGEKVLTGLAVTGILAVPMGVAAGSFWLAITGIGFLVVVLAANARLIRWFARLRGPWFAVGIIPLRVLYYMLNGASVVVALVQRLIARVKGDEPDAPTRSRNRHALESPGQTARNEPATGQRTR
jgi:glycosyltransferase involved in cell wall biosynthesis